jgi:hypothetical protein
MDDFEPIDIRAIRESRSLKAGHNAFADKASAPQVVPSTSKPLPANVTFDRHELREILNVYGRKVAEGEWRDYAIDFTANLAVFSIFRRTSEMPLYRIEKNPKMARKQGMYAVVAATGLILKRGHDLATVISVLEKKLKVVR